MRDPVQVTLRVTLVDPPPGVLFGVQSGKAGVLSAVRSNGASLSFDFPGELRPGKDGEPVLYGPHAQGPPAERFIYVNSGAMAGDAADWQRRAKIPLRGLTWELADEALRTPGAVLAAHIAGKAKDGGPVCASIPLLPPGWHVEQPA